MVLYSMIVYCIELNVLLNKLLPTPATFMLKQHLVEYGADDMIKIIVWVETLIIMNFIRLPGMGWLVNGHPLTHSTIIIG